MKFSEFLLTAIRRAEIPVRFEPGAEEAIVAPVVKFLRAWIGSHEPDQGDGEFERGQMTLIHDLLQELEDKRPIG